jgi:anti-sigma factor RsiW
MTWHADTGLLHRYARGELGDVAAASVEAHVTACATCRQLAVTCADTGALTRIKAGLDDRLDAPPMTRTQRVLRRVGLDERDTRLVTGALSLETSWVAASLLVLCFALTAATLGTNRPTVGLFVALAPLVPLAGVALAYAPRVDPTFEIAQASPMPAVRLLLVRAGTVVTLTVPVLIVLSAPFGELPAFAWLLPALALIAVALAVGTYWPLPAVAATLAGLWVAGATLAISEAPALTGDAFARHFVVVQWPGQLICAAVGAGSIAVFATRRHTYEVPR